MRDFPILIQREIFFDLELLFFHSESIETYHDARFTRIPIPPFIKPKPIPPFIKRPTPNYPPIPEGHRTSTCYRHYLSPPPAQKDLWAGGGDK